MIITGYHPDAKNIMVYDKYGSVIDKIIEVDTHQMLAKQFIRFEVSTGTMVTRTISVYKIKGPGIYFKRKPKKSRTINTRRK
jgi:hypothetical protein